MQKAIDDFSKGVRLDSMDWSDASSMVPIEVDLGTTPPPENTAKITLIS